MNESNKISRALLIESKGSFSLHPRILESKRKEIYNFLKFDLTYKSLTKTVITRREGYNSSLLNYLKKTYSIEMFSEVFKEYNSEKKHIQFYSSSYTKTHGPENSTEIDVDYDSIYFLPTDKAEYYFSLKDKPLKVVKENFKIFEYTDFDQMKKRYAKIDISLIGKPSNYDIFDFMTDEGVKKHYENRIEKDKEALKKSREEYMKFLSKL